jgi:hypothetical protein
LLADHFRCQAGSYDAAYKLLSETLEVEEKELGARPEQMADLLFLMADILSEREKLVVFISEETVKQSCQIIDYTKRSIVLRRQLASQNHEVFLYTYTYMKGHIITHRPM